MSKAETHSGVVNLQPYYGQMQYHLGWVDEHFSPAASNPGKLLRPTLLLLSYEVAGAWGLAEEKPCRSDYLRRALPAAVSVELTHNFTLIHDDIEDGDVERRHRPTLWKIWGIPQSINAGDGLFALSRLVLWEVLDEGVEGTIAARLGRILDHSCLTLSEGQYLDISFEQRDDISVSMYLDMISRKTAVLMSCATEMGAILGTRDQETIDRLRSFGSTIGIAFQIRDDLLGVWATKAELGKTQAGDIYRRKKSLPVLYALEHADIGDQQLLRNIYQQDLPITSKEVDDVLAVFTRTRAREYCCTVLARQCQRARQVLSEVQPNAGPISVHALGDMEALVHFLEDTSP
ncbi:MAG: polyprenyl synthetase family protein [Ktedonobacteraceae bacterium]|nr:polyprenyl synthetase family protein [Ktedonobacteraceae bacterium]